MKNSQQLWFAAPCSLEFRDQELAEPEADEILVRTLLSGISSGTEMLAYRGQLPHNQTLDPTIQALENQATSYPLQYGYACVGLVEAAGDRVDKKIIGRHVFALQPHATHFLTKASSVVELPESMVPDAAVFLANMETAVNLVLDAQPALGENVVILGQGVVGLLVTATLSRFPLAARYALEPVPLRRAKALMLGADSVLDPGRKNAMAAMQSALDTTRGQGADLVLELTGSPDALNLAVELCAYSGRIIVGSWYGNKPVTLDLGGRFHRDRIELVSSQVSSISPKLSGRWDRERRFATALAMIESVSPEQLITHRIEFGSAHEAYNLLDSSPDTALQVVLTYPD